MPEYESNSRSDENHIKYLDYAQRILDREYQEEKVVRAIRFVDIYTSDVANVGEQLNAGNVGIQYKPVLLCEHNRLLYLNRRNMLLRRFFLSLRQLEEVEKCLKKDNMDYFSIDEE